MVQGKLIIDGKEISVFWFTFGFNQGADRSGRPSQRPVFVGLKLTIETRKDLNLAEWSFAPNQAKQIELHIYPVILGGKTRKLYFYDCHLIGWNNSFSSTGTNPMSETLEITCAGVKDSNSIAEYSTYWRTTFPQQEVEPTTIDNNEPNFISYHLEDIENNRINKKEININEEFFIILKTEYSEGESISIDLEDTSKDYEYNGRHMKNDIIRNIAITGNLTKVKIKAIEQQN